MRCWRRSVAWSRSANHHCAGALTTERPKAVLDGSAAAEPMWTSVWVPAGKHFQLAGSLRPAFACASAILLLVGEVRTVQCQDTAPTVQRLQPGDLLRVTVWRKPEYTGEFLVTPEGTLEHPLFQNVHVAGVPLSVAKARLTEVLGGLEKNPLIVLVPLLRVSVAGEVHQPNLYSVPAGTTFAQVIALAGGPTEQGQVSKVRVLRGKRLFQMDLTDPESGAVKTQVVSGDQIVIARAGNFFRDVLAPMTERHRGSRVTGSPFSYSVGGVVGAGKVPTRRTDRGQFPETAPGARPPRSHSEDEPQVQSLLDLRTVILAVRRHPWLIMATAVGCLGLAFHLARKEPAAYQASAVVRLEDKARSMAGGLVSDPTRPVAGRSIDPLLSQIQILTSRAVAEAVVDSTPAVRVGTQGFTLDLLRGLSIEPSVGQVQVELDFLPRTFVARSAERHGERGVWVLAGGWWDPFHHRPLAGHARGRSPDF